MSSFLYLDALLPILQRAFESQRDLLSSVADRMAEVVAGDHLIYIFGSGHAEILAEELFYRAGGLVPVIPIFGPGLSPTTHPSSLSTSLERLNGLSPLLLESSTITNDDLLIIHSNSGRNAAAIEMAQAAHQLGIFVIALTSIAHSRSAPSRHPSGLKLMDIADAVIDNCGEAGDAAVALPGMMQRAGPTSTVVGAALLNALVVETARRLLERGFEPPIFTSANVDGGEAANQRWLDHYSTRLTYL